MDDLTIEERATNHETWQHINQVRKLLQGLSAELMDRALLHDSSKLERPEVQIFTEFTPKLKGLTCGSDEYKQCLKDMGPALDHHYQENRHHPEHFENGIEDMTLIDLMEMLCDWKAATLRHADAWGRVAQPWRPGTWESATWGSSAQAHTSRRPSTDSASPDPTSL